MRVGPNQKNLSIVVPLFNEEESIGPLIAELEAAWVSLASGQQWELILVDDGSSDGTFKRSCDELGFSKLSGRVIRLQRNFGQTAAMQAGIDASVGEFIATIDGDLQNDPADIPRMVQYLRENDLDLLVGRRARRQDGMLLRKVPSWIANRLIGRVTGVKIRDYGCSLKIYRATVIKHIRLMGEMHRFIPAWVASVTSPERIGELDVNHRARKFGTSKYGISRTLRVVLDLVSVLYFMKFRSRPGHFFGTMGVAIGALGATMLSIVMVAKFILGQDIGTRPALLLGAFSLFTSLQLIAFGIMAEVMTRIYHQGSEQASYVVRTTTGGDSTEHSFDIRAYRASA